MLRSSGFAALVVALAFSMSVSACGGAVGLIEPTPVPNPSPSPGLRPANIKIKSVSPLNGADLYYGQDRSVSPQTRVSILSYDLGDQKCDGVVSIAGALTDRPGYFIWNSVQQFTLGQLEGFNKVVYPQMADTLWDRRISQTTKAMAYLVCDGNLQSPPGPEVSRSSELFPYKEEARFVESGAIMARDEQDVTWNWRQRQFR